MVSTNKFKTTTDFLNSTTLPNMKGYFHIDSISNELEKSNETFRYFTKDDDPETIRLKQIEKSLAIYRSIYSTFPTSQEYISKLAKSSEIMKSSLDKIPIAPNLSLKELNDIIRITARYMMLNEMELLFFLAAVSNLNSNDFTHLYWGELIQTCDSGVVFKEESIDGKKDQGFMTLLMISFFLALSAKTLCNSGAEQVFFDAFLSLLSPQSSLFYEHFVGNNGKLSSFSLIELNDISKRLDSLESAKTNGDNSLVNDGMLEGLPSKKRQYDEEEVMNIFFNKDYS